MYKEFFKHLGLTDGQCSIYLSLIEKGPMNARKISITTKIPRTLCYKVLEDMIKIGIVYKEDTPDNPISTFFPSSPSKFNNLITKKKEEVELLNATFNAVSGSLGSEWNRMWKKPSISLYEGLEGLKKINEDILHSKVSEIYVLSSPMDQNEDLRGMIRDQITQQAKMGIKTKAITPLRENLIANIDTERDKSNLVVRKKIDQRDLPIPAQIVIYGDKISITNFSNNVTNFVIQSEKTAETLKLIFEFLWKKIP